ncbi:MAG: hypothetical protein LW724_03945 [Planctomycetaceae bacterium]|jgi:uncharacterized tellurite resistance protein B-like protein|nr:hypothetical protein [Planctomycetaceae bacterium]
MADADSLQNRCRSLENAFFSDLDQKLIRDLQEKLSAEEAVTNLRAESGIKDDAALRALHGLGITPQALSAFRIFPLVAVAWADGQADQQEATAVRMIAERYLTKGSEASTLLERWLKEKPSSEMLTTWESCAEAVFSSIDAKQSNALKHQLVEEVDEVARTSGGLLGFGATTKSESDMIARIKKALSVA